MSKVLSIWLLVAIVVVGVGLRSYELTARSLWFDEAFSWRLISFPLPELLARDAADVHPPLYYLLLKVWAIIFGSTLLSLRLFSVTLAGVTIALTYLFAAYAFRSRTTGLVAALLVALAGFQIQFAWEARMYTLGTALALASTWALLHAIRQQPQRAWWWAGYGVLVALFAYTHYYAFFTIIAQALFVMAYLVAATRGRVGEMLQWPLLWYALLAVVIAVVLFAPWLPTFLEQRARVEQAFWIPALTRWSIPDTFYRMYIPTAGSLSHEGLTAIARTLAPLAVTGIAAVALAIIGWYRRAINDVAWLTLLCIACPFVVSTVLSLLSRSSVYQDRFLVFAHLFVLILWAALLARLPGKAVRWGVIIIAVVGLLTADYAYWRDLNILGKPGAQVATRKLFEQHQAGEPIIVSSPFIFFAVDHYAQETFASKEIPKLYSESGELIHFAGGPILQASDIVGPSFIETFTGQSLWVVDTTGFGATPLQLPASWAPVSSATFEEVHDYQGTVTITHYQRQ